MLVFLLFFDLGMFLLYGFYFRWTPRRMLGSCTVKTGQEGVDSSKLTWKRRGALNEATILHLRPSVSFHVNLGGRVEALSVF